MECTSRRQKDIEKMNAIYTDTNDSTIHAELIQVQYVCPVHGVMDVKNPYSRTTDTCNITCPLCGSVMQAIEVYAIIDNGTAVNIMETDGGGYEFRYYA